MTTVTTLCVHCERETGVPLPGEDTEIVGKSKEMHSISTQWAASTCENCDRQFGVRYGDRGR